MADAPCNLLKLSVRQYLTFCIHFLKYCAVSSMISRMESLDLLHPTFSFTPRSSIVLWSNNSNSRVVLFIHEAVMPVTICHTVKTVYDMGDKYITTPSPAP